MKQNRLSSSIIAGIVLAAGYAGGAQAVHLNQRGTGEVLLYPYYTVQAGNQTLLSVVNTTAAGKAVKVRFREGRNSRTVVDFHVYMAPFDTWTASVFSLSDTGTGNPANLITLDNTCTVPRIKGNNVLPALANGNRYVPFFNYAYTNTNNDAGPDTLDRTREGHIELIEMGEVVNRSKGSLTAITPDSETGLPTNCVQVQYAWQPVGVGVDTYWSANASTDMDPPQGGLFGTAAIVDALQGTLMSYQADAIGDFSDIVQHTLPGASQPTLASARSSSTAATAHVFSDGASVSSSYPLSQAIDAVSALFVQDQIFNEFVTASSVGGASEWVVTFPTKYAYTDQAIVGSVALPPFTQTFPQQTTPTNSGAADVDIAMAISNREASQTVDTPPSGIAPGKLSFATNVIGFPQPGSGTNGSTILGSRLVKNVSVHDANAFDGWASLNLYAATAPSGSSINQQQMRADLAGGRWSGLPAQGFWAVSYTNGQLTPGVLSNYGDIVKHRGSADYQAAP